MDEDNASAGIERMAFFADGGLSAWETAEAFAGPGGRVATLPDIVDCRISGHEHDAAWNRYYTTTSAEYYGTTRGGVPVLAVAHGVGPLADRDACAAAYAYSLVDNDDRSKRGARIARAEFHRLLDGAYGEVAVVELAPYLGLHRYSFSSLTMDEAFRDPLAAARFGGEERLARYLVRQAAFDAAYAKEQGRPATGGRLLRLSDDSNNGYKGYVDGPDGKFTEVPRTVEDGLAIAALLSVSQLTNMSEGGGRSSVQVDVSPHDWHDGTRFCGFRAGVGPGAIEQGASIEWAQRHRPDLLWSDGQGEAAPAGRMAALVRRGETWFTQYPKEGARLDTGEAMHLVTGLEQVGTGVLDTSGSGPFFRYDLSEVEAIAPAGANAYVLDGEAYAGGTGRMRHDVRFFKVQVDTRRRMLRSRELAADMALQVRLAEAKRAA